MTIVYFDCFAGASGDMILAALLDAGAPLEAVREELSKLPMGGYELVTERVIKKGIAALNLTVQVEEHNQPHRHFSDIEKMIRESGLSPRVKEISLAVFTRLAEAEGKIHGRPPEKVHFHEVGAVDSIVDIVGIAAALCALGEPALYSSPLHTGSGFVRCAHGLLPVPAPATAELVKGLPVYSQGVEAELLTPTGAAVLATLAKFGPLPAMTVGQTGYGAGKKDLPFANVLRVILGQENTPAGLAGETVAVLEAGIDDMNPEFYGYIMERLFAAGALDVSLTPLQMKKNRPGVHLTVLVLPAKEAAVLEILLTETTTLGVRRSTAEKIMLRRRQVTVKTPYGPAHVKLAESDGRETNAAPEYEDCVALAKASGLPLKEIYALVLAAYRRQQE